MKHILILTIALAMPAFARAEEKGSSAADEAAILKLEKSWPDVIVKRDTAAMLSMSTDDCTFVYSSGEVIPLKQVVADVKSGAMTVESMHIDDLKVRVYGDTAIVFGLETEKSKYKDEDSSGQYRFADTWLKRNGRWLCAASANTKVTPAKP
jgi:uncharacterized protein (TIGR02246 family)